MRHSMIFLRQTYKTSTDEELMRAIQSGEVGAFDVLYERYSRRMLNYFFRRLGNDENSAQDMLQDLFVKIVEKPHLFNSEKRFSTWIYAVASNMCKNEYRRRDIRKIEQPLPGPDALLDAVKKVGKPDDVFEKKEFGHAVYQKLNELHEDKQNTFLLRFQHQLSIKEISETLDCSEGTVKSRLFYTIRVLAAELHEYNPKKR